MNRTEENIIWAANAVFVIVYTAIMIFVPGGIVIVPALICGTLMLIFLSASLLSCDGYRKVMLTCCLVLSVVMCIMSGTLWCGLLFPGIIALCSHYDYILKKESAHTFCCLLLLFISFAYGIIRKGAFDLTGIAVCAALFVFGVLWSIFVIFLRRYFRLHSGMEMALRSSALEALRERELRIEIAENKNLAEENARLEERERISRDIHNSVGHTLSAATVTLDAAQMLMEADPERANIKIDQANERIHEAIDSVRSVVRTLDSKDDSMLIRDYISSLTELIRRFTMDTDLKVHHNLDMIRDDGSIKIGIAAFISSTVSEFLTNGVRHGGADAFVLIMTLDDANIGLQISDNGRGWGDITPEQRDAKLKNGFGLRKIEAHVKTEGGNIEFSGNDGFRVKLSLPRK